MARQRARGRRAPSPGRGGRAAGGEPGRGRAAGGPGEGERSHVRASVRWRGFRRGNVVRLAEGRATTGRRPGSAGEAELLEELLAVAAPEREDLAVAEGDDHGDPGVGRAAAGLGDEVQEADQGAVDLVGRLDVHLEAVPEVLDLLEPARDPAVAAVAGALVQQA